MNVINVKPISIDSHFKEEKIDRHLHGKKGLNAVPITVRELAF